MAGKRRPAQALVPVLSILCVALFCGPARAEDPHAGSPLYDPLSHPLSTEVSIAPLIPALYEFKKALLDLGFNFQVNYTGEVLGNPVGGAQQSAAYEGLLEIGIDGDLNVIAGLKGASFHINAFEIHGYGLSTYNIFNFATISGIEARRTTRLFEAWFDQELFGGLASIRFGQLSADSEFLANELDVLYWNGTFGWPVLVSFDLPGTGLHYPLTTPGVRLKITPDEQTAFLFAIFNGDPAGVGFDFAQAEVKNCCGINFRMKDPPLLFGQADFTYVLPFGAQGLTGKLRIGSWYHFGRFNDQFLATNGLPLVNPASSRVPVSYFGDQAAYTLIDQMIWKAPGDDPWKGIGFFVLAMVSPQDRNLISLEIQAGVNFMGILDARPNDTFGVAFDYSRVSPSVSASDQAAALFSALPVPVRNYELLLEATYQAQIVPGFFIQPDFQYVFHPGGGAINPLNPISGRIPDAAVFGLRTVVKF
ncbi:MAG: carbohydrate porin [Beijerinckiaceae bacterium]|nr:carbohydrate porin [Beijerinckiaceae bacterium]